MERAVAVDAPRPERPRAVALPKKLQSWLDAAADLERDILSTDYLDVEMVDAVGVALERRRAHVRLVVDFAAPETPRLRVRVVDRSGGWWLIDSYGLVAPRPRFARAALARLDVRAAAS